MSLTKFDSRQSVLRSALPMVGSAVNAGVDSVLIAIDPELSKLFEDRNILLADGGLVTFSSAGTSIAFSTNLRLHINSQVAGGSPTIIDLGSASRTVSANGRMVYAVINRTLGTASVTDDASTLPVVTSSNQEVVLIAKRIDSGDGTKQVYFRNGFVLSSGQTSRINETSILYGESNTDSSTTGTNATLASSTFGVVRLTNGSLVSVSGIPAGASGQFLIIENKTGNSIAINNDEATATAANRIFTGTAANVSMPNNATFAFTYDTTSSRWMLTGGSGSGSGSGGSGKNYLTVYTASTSSGGANAGNGNFESGSTTGWSLAHTSLSSLFPSSTAAAGTPFDSTHGGSAASGNLSLSTVSSSQLAGSYSGSLASSAASVAGDLLISSAFFIDKEDQAKMMQITFSYSAISGTFDFSGSSTNTFAVYIYDVTNGAWIQPQGVYNLVQSSGVGFCTATFQTTSNSTQYQLALVNINATSGAYTLYIDDLTVGPQHAPTGPAMTDWISYTPTFTGFGTPSNVNFLWRRVGDSVQINGYWTNGTTTGVTAQITLPAGQVTDSSYTTLTVVGWGGDNHGAGDRTTVPLAQPSQAYLEFGKSNSAVPAMTAQLGNAWTTGDNMSFFATLKVAGWSSNTSVSSDTDTRVVVLSADGTPATTTAGNPIIVPTVLSDTHAAYNASTGRYTIPVSGYYTLNTVFLSGQPTTTEIHLYKNGSDTNIRVAQTNANGGSSGSVTVLLNAGDIVDFRPITNSLTWGQATLGINRLSGPAVIAATETVIAQAYSGTNITVTASTNVVFPTVKFDTHSAYNTSTGVYTAPVSGFYRISVCGLYNNGITSTNDRLVINVNGTLYNTIAELDGATVNEINNGTIIVKANAGDQIAVFSQTSFTLATTASFFPMVTFERLK